MGDKHLRQFLENAAQDEAGQEQCRASINNGPSEAVGQRQNRNRDNDERVRPEGRIGEDRATRRDRSCGYGSEERNQQLDRLEDVLAPMLEVIEPFVETRRVG